MKRLSTALLVAVGVVALSVALRASSTCPLRGAGAQAAVQSCTAAEQQQPVNCSAGCCPKDEGKPCDKEKECPKKDDADKGQCDKKPDCEKDKGGGEKKTI